jgi:predicted house-cleaning noncanonical NTP pyrophosphatase (MazG superfamily)
MKPRTFKLNKLVRDKIVQLHLDMGGGVEHKTLKGTELNEALVQKLIEEAVELKNSELSAGELADLQEIIDQLAKNLGITEEELAAKQKAKREKTGGFEKGHFINTVTLPADNKWADYYAKDPTRFPEVK